MAPTVPHALLTCRRRVPPEARARYHAAWQAVAAAAAATGMHAWLFRAPEDEALYLEFLEWAAADVRDDPSLRPQLAAALDALDRAFPAERERWTEVFPTPEET